MKKPSTFPSYSAKFYNARYLELFHGRPGFNSLATLVNSQLRSAFCRLGFLTCCVKFEIFVSSVKCSAPLAPCYNHLPRVNKGHLVIFIFFKRYMIYKGHAITCTHMITDTYFTLKNNFDLQIYPVSSFNPYVRFSINLILQNVHL